MSRLILANPDTASMVPAARYLPDRFLRLSAASAKRMLWVVDEGDAIITPTSISDSFREYVAHMNGHATIGTSVGLVDHPGTRPLPIAGSDALHNMKARNVLSELARKQAISVVEPYIADETAMAFARSLGDIPVSFGQSNIRASPALTRHLNDKAEFRSFANGLGVPVADGATCGSDVEVHDAVRRTLDVTGTVVLKAARHSGAGGNHSISNHANHSLPGVSSTRQTSRTSADVEKAVRDTGLVATRHSPVVVEAYFENEVALGVHYDVSNEAASLTGAAEILLNPTFGGVLWSLEVLAQVPSDVLDWSQSLADYCRNIGYSGPLSVDIVKSRSRGYFATEVNGRHGGFSTARSVARSVGIDKHIDNGHKALLARNGVDIDLSVGELIETIRDGAMHYDAASGTGVVLMSEGVTDAGPYDFVVVGVDRREVMAIQNALLAAVPTIA